MRGLPETMKQHPDQLKIARIVEENTLTGTFVLASGRLSSTYIDMRAAILNNSEFIAYYMNYMVGYDRVPIGTGASGALLLGCMRRKGYLFNPKDHGVMWSPQPVAGTLCTLIDDVLTSGATMMRLKEEAEKVNLIVTNQVVLYDRSMLS